MTGTFQLNSDAFPAYKGAIVAGLHDRADYAQIIKLYGGPRPRARMVIVGKRFKKRLLVYITTSPPESQPLGR